ncbi:MAG: hypothetical protein ACXAEF_15375 [Candidatus Thorarchaeota archaeon]
MRMCKCGKANQPTRKYCIRCGESLIGQEKKKTPAAPAPEPEPAPAAPIETAAPEESSYQPVGAPDKMSPTTDDAWVRPSEVDSDRVRTADRHVDKTETEKAQDAFEKAEDEDIDGRMLRASEIKELMEEAPAEITPEPSEVATPVATEPVIHETTPAPVPEPISVATTEELTPPPAPPPEMITTSTDPPIAEEATGFSAVTSEPPVTDPDIDKRIQEIDSDIAQFTINLQKLEEELDEIKSKNEGNVKWASTVAEQKRIKLEESEDALRRAKEEFSLASKDFRSAEDRSKKEVDAAQKRVSDLQKRIVNAGKAREKRLKEIEKEKQKG